MKDSCPSEYLSPEQVEPQIRRRANRIARLNHAGPATRIILGSEDRLVHHVKGEFVDSRTGKPAKQAIWVNGRQIWRKGIRYQHASTVVELDFQEEMITIFVDMMMGEPSPFKPADVISKPCKH